MLNKVIVLTCMLFLILSCQNMLSEYDADSSESAKKSAYFTKMTEDQELYAGYWLEESLQRQRIEVDPSLTSLIYYADGEIYVGEQRRAEKRSYRIVSGEDGVYQLKLTSYSLYTTNGEMINSIDDLDDDELALLDNQRIVFFINDEDSSVCLIRFFYANSSRVDIQFMAKKN